LYSTDQYDVLDESSREQLHELRDEFSAFKMQNLKIERPVFVGEKYITLYTFAGTKVNRTLNLLLTKAGAKPVLNDERSLLELAMPKQEFDEVWSCMLDQFNDLDEYLSQILETNPALIDFSKWGIYLPTRLKLLLLKQRYFDIEGTTKFLIAMKLFPAFELADKEGDKET
jgi:ATP-dependent helicase Lhr and Lhr-like helicase